MLLVYCQVQVTQSKKGGVRERERARERERRKHMPKKSNECVLLTEVPGARLRGSDGGKSCSFH